MTAPFNRHSPDESSVTENLPQHKASGKSLGSPGGVLWVAVHRPCGCGGPSGVQGRLSPNS